MSELAQLIHQRLCNAYGEPQWRTPLLPIDELVSTILSQNTNDQNRDRAFCSLKDHFSSWAAVRDASTEEVCTVIRPAGLANRKAPTIQTILRIISAEQSNKEKDPFDLTFLTSLPSEDIKAWFMRFKGVGRKTTAIVMLFSLGIPAFPVDTHIYRVTGRLGLRPKEMTVEQTHDLLEKEFSPAAYASAHLNIIRLGREICQARRLLCSSCPLQDFCSYVKNG